VKREVEKSPKPLRVFHAGASVPGFRARRTCSVVTAVARGALTDLDDQILVAGDREAGVGVAAHRVKDRGVGSIQAPASDHRDGLALSFAPE